MDRKIIASVNVTINGTGPDAEFSFDFKCDSDPPLPSAAEYIDLTARGDVNIDAAREAMSAMIHSRFINALDQEWFAIKSELHGGKESECTSTSTILH